MHDIQHIMNIVHSRNSRHSYEVITDTLNVTTLYKV